MPAFTSFRIVRAPVAARPVVPRATAINNEIRKDLDSVTNSLKVGTTDEFTKTFPLCNNAHINHNKETGDNVGPLYLDTGDLEPDLDTPTQAESVKL